MVTSSIQFGTYNNGLTDRLKAGSSFVSKKLPSGSWTTSTLSKPDADWLSDQMERCLLNNRFSAGFKTDGAAYDVNVVSSEEDSFPDSVPFDFRTKNPNKDFHKRQKEGEIVVSSYQVGKGRIAFHRSNLMEEQWSLESTTSPGPSYLTTATGYNPFGGTFKNGILLPSGWVWGGYFRIQWKRYRMRRNVHPFQMGWSLSDCERLMNKFKDEHKVDPALIQSVAAKANVGNLDALTAVAELPETVESIANALRRVAGITREFKNKELGLSNATMKRRQAIEKRLAEMTYGDKKSYRKYLQEQRSLKKALKQTAKEFTDAVANLWMWYRYEVMPNALLIRDLAYALHGGLKTYAKYRKRVISKSKHEDLNGYMCTGELQYIDRCIIKRSFSIKLNILSQIYSATGFNLLVTGFELMKRSFVLDWFLTIGDCLKSITFDKMYDDQAACKSTKVDGSLRYSHPKFPELYVAVEGDSYTRTVINPCDYSGIYFRPEMNLNRTLDSFAMLWPTIKHIFHSKKS